MNQSHFLAIFRNLLKAQETLRVQGVIGLIWPCYSLIEKLARDLRPITKHGNRKRVNYFRQSFENYFIKHCTRPTKAVTVSSLTNVFYTAVI